MNKHPGILALVSLLAGGAGLYLLLVGGGPILMGSEPYLAAACHVLSGFFGFHSAKIADSRRVGGHWFQLAVSFGIPFFGGIVAFYLSETLKNKKTGHLADEFAVYLSDAATFRESVPISDLEAPPAEDVVSLADILAHPVSESEQRIAVENLASMETPMAMEILRKVIESDDGEGRFFAMTALGQVEDKMLTKLQALEEDLDSGRDESPAALMGAARTYLDFSYYQLAQDERRSEYLGKAKKLLERALADPDADPEGLILLGRIELLNYNTKDALARFNAYLAKNPASRPGLLWRAEAWFMLGEYARVREDCQKALDLDQTQDNIRETAIFWAENAMRREKESMRILKDRKTSLVAERPSDSRSKTTAVRSKAGVTA